MRQIEAKVAVLATFVVSLVTAEAAAEAAAPISTCSSDSNGNAQCGTVESSNMNSTVGSSRSNDNDNDTSFQCNIYLAPSSIPNAGFGLYTVKDIETHERVMSFTDAPSIPLCDEKENGLNAEHWNHVDYLWSGKGLAEFECDQISESVMTFGSLCNFHTYLANVTPENAKYDDTIGGGRFTNPGAGAFSYHTGHDFHANADISAGEEIFCDYGETWLDQRLGTFADTVPRETDFETAAKAFLEVLKNIRQHDLEVTDGVLELLKNVSTMFDKRAASVFPVTKELFHEIMTITAENEDANLNEIAKLLAQKITIEKHDVPWILENGICMEKIRPGISNIPGAGRGAFAQEFIPKGTMVSPAPLLNIIDRDLLNMYNVYDEEVVEDSELIGKQLLLNYCFGHKDSQLLLCPQSNMILMNHYQKTCVRKDNNCDDNDGEEVMGPNAKIQWADGWDPHTADWLELPFHEVVALTEDRRRGLSFEVVATRDILPGEEVTIDYGENWQKAWDEHVATWEVQMPIDDGSYIPVRTIMDEADYRTLEEQEENPYPGNILTVCYYPEGFEDYPDGGYEEEEWDGSGIIPPYGMDVAYDLYPCDIVERNEDEDENEESFTVDIFPAYDSDDSESIRLIDYPKESVSFRMWPYKSDVHLPNAFRHYMEIPDEIFPDNWKIGQSD